MSTKPVEAISNVQLAAVTAQIGSYTVPVNTVYKVYEILFCNSNSTPEGVDFHLVPNGGSATDSNKILHKSGYFIPAYGTRTFALEQRLAAGATFHGSSTTANKVSVHTAGDEVVL